MLNSVETYRYYSASVGDLTNVSIIALSHRIAEFRKIHKNELDIRVRLAGGKPK